MFISQIGKNVDVRLTVEGWKGTEGLPTASEVQGCFTTVLLSETYNLSSNLKMITVTLTESEG